MKKLLTILSVLLLVSCGSQSSQKPTVESPVEEEKVVEIPLDQKIRNASTVDEVRQLIDGTTWHHTKNLNDSKVGCWLKVKFENGRFTHYYALPSDGQWTQAGTGTYKVTEGRFADSGERYIAVEWEGKIKADFLTIPFEYKLVTNNFEIHLFSSLMDGMDRLQNGHYAHAMRGNTHYVDTMELGDYSWD